MLYVTDNANAEIWLQKRVAKNRLARYGLRLLQMLEARHDFHVTSAGVWTKHNQSMDLLSRETKEVVQTEMNRLGLVELDLRTPWLETLGGIKKGQPLVMPGDTQEQRTRALQLMARREAPGPRSGLLTESA